MPIEPARAPLILGADRLARVFDNRNAAGRIGNLLNLVHRGTLAEQVHGNDRLGVAA